MNRVSVIAAAMMAAVACVSQAQSNPHVLMISVDGMRPDYVTRADEHGLKIPTLRHFITAGTYAQGVAGVIPTVTYPSHTTLITGVWPNEHGIIENTTFDPMNQHPGEWYWFFNALKSKTLYMAAREGGLTTATVSWPVTVGAPVDYLIAEDNQSEDTDTPQGALIYPRNLKEMLNVTLPEKPTKDDKNTAYSTAIIQKYQPNFMLIHIVELDHAEHGHGPFSAEANAQLETIDAQIGQIIAAERTVDPKAKIVIVSDHGFLPVEHNVHLNAMLVEAGLMKIVPGAKKAKRTKIESWDVSAWNAGGSSFLMVRDSNNKAAMAKLDAVVKTLRSDPKYGVEKVMSREETVKLGGMKDAMYTVEFKRGFSSGGEYAGPVVVDAPGTGTHGYLASFPEMRSTFMAEGGGIAAGKDLGVIDMRQIAPTVAQMMGVSLPAAKLKPVNVKDRAIPPVRLGAGKSAQ